jgi:isopenicillin N synthase-like dioxygenase
MDNLTAPDMRGEIKDDPESLYLMDHPDSDEEIPTLDISSYLHGEPGGREKVAAELRHISMTVGFFYLTGHRIPDHVFDGIFAQARRLHGLLPEAKSKLPYVDHGTFKSGYQSGAEERERANVNIISSAMPNLLSKFQVNREGGSDGLGMTEKQRRIERNVWPEDLLGFKEVVMDYHGRIEKLGREFLPLWATSLKLPLDYFDKYFATPHVTLSLLHYPPQKDIGNRQYGIAPHTDNAMMTFLAQANVPGLAVRMPSGHWRLIDIVPGTLLVNTGNLVVRWD